MICELLGVPTKDQDSFREWTTTLLTYNTQEAVAAAGAAMSQYLLGLVEEKRKAPGDDFFSALVHAGRRAPGCRRMELVSMAFLLLVAGHETTVNLIGNAVLALLRNSAQLALLKEKPELIAASTEEFLRYEGPVEPVDVPLHRRAGRARRCDDPEGRVGPGVAARREP